VAVNPAGWWRGRVVQSLKNHNGCGTQQYHLGAVNVLLWNETHNTYFIKFYRNSVYFIYHKTNKNASFKIKNKKFYTFFYYIIIKSKTQQIPYINMEGKKLPLFLQF